MATLLTVIRQNKWKVAGSLLVINLFLLLSIRIGIPGGTFPEIISTLINDELLIFTFFLSLIIPGIVIFNYLRKIDTQSWTDDKSTAALERDLGSQLNSLKREFEATARKEAQRASDRLSSTLDKRITDQVDEKITDIVGDDIVSLVGERLAKSSDEYTWRLRLRDDLTDRFNTSRNRIDELATKAEKSATVFRQIGIGLALTGLSLAGWKFVVFLRTDFTTIGNEWQGQLIAHATTTLPVVLLAEALALIMFRYHSRSLEQMRYFANEVTTLSLRFASSVIIAQHGSKKDIVDLAKEMARQERNFILKKGEATLETAQNADEDAMVDKLIEKLRPKLNSRGPRTTNTKKANQGVGSS